MNFTKTVQGDTESISIINSENSRKLRRVKGGKNQSQNNDSNFHSPIIKKKKENCHYWFHQTAGFTIQACEKELPSNLLNTNKVSKKLLNTQGPLK